MRKTIVRSNDTTGIQGALLELISRIPESDEAAAEHPKQRAQSIASAAALKTATISGTMALPPGFLGLATILPDLILIWKAQQQMVADIAAVYGKTHTLQKETMLYCLFKHASATAVRQVVTRVGERFLVRRATTRLIQQSLQKVGVRVTQRVVGQGISRWLPLVGALGVGAYAYYDTTQVAATAIELFKGEIEIE